MSVWRKSLSMVLVVLFVMTTLVTPVHASCACDHMQTKHTTATSCHDMAGSAKSDADDGNKPCCTDGCACISGHVTAASILPGSHAAQFIPFVITRNMLPASDRLVDTFPEVLKEPPKFTS